MSSSVTIDISLFTNIYQDPLSLAPCRDFKACIAIKRLLVALRYYQSLDVKSNEQHQNVFTNFINEIYQHPLLIQDFHHFTKKHCKKLYDVMKYAIDNKMINQCQIETCENATRHYRINGRHDTVSKDKYLNIYGNTLDSFHYLLLHSNDAGLRCFTGKEAEDGSVQTSKAAKDDCYDPEFNRIGQMIKKTQEATRRFNRIADGNKFTISANDGSDRKNYDELKDDYFGITYLDTVIQHLEDKRIKREAITKLVQYLKHHQFDTESIDIDVGDGSSDGNIPKYMENEPQCLNMLISKLKDTKGMLVISIKF